MEVLLKYLKKNDVFIFNDKRYTVKRKYIDDDRPLIAFCENDLEEQRFYHDGLEVIKAD